MCIDPPLPLATPPLRPEEEMRLEAAAGGARSSVGFGHSSRLTCQLGQDLFDGNTAGQGVSVGPVGGDQVVGGRDGGLDACCASFLQNRRGWESKLGALHIDVERIISPVRHTGGRSL